ncbi:MAG: phage recombination protein Bet, partial [Patescibacteria group bacterium]|nr:phage recombination protein Bet [Patescibacteria group bacterium]
MASYYKPSINNTMTKEIIKIEGMTPDKVELIKNTVAKGATDNELSLFLTVAKRSGLDPFTKQIHFVKRGDTGTIQTGIDGYRAIAEHTGTLAGIDDATFDSEENQYPKKASVTVYRLIGGQRVPFTASARWSEYAPIYNGQLGKMWQKMPYLMLAKCAEALALRKAFPNDLSNLYTNEEMQQAAGY